MTDVEFIRLVSIRDRVNAGEVHILELLEDGSTLEIVKDSETARMVLVYRPDRMPSDGELYMIRGVLDLDDCIYWDKFKIDEFSPFSYCAAVIAMFDPVEFGLSGVAT